MVNVTIDKDGMTEKSWTCDICGEQASEREPASESEIVSVSITLPIRPHIHPDDMRTPCKDCQAEVEIYDICKACLNTVLSRAYENGDLRFR